MTHRRSSSSPGRAAPKGRAPATPRIPACPDDAGQLHELVIELEPRKSFLNSVIQMVEKFGEEHGVPDGPIYRVNLEIDELLTNYVLHRLDRSRKARIEVRVRLFRDRLVLVFLDTGPPFDPRTIEPPPEAETLEEVSLGGVGLHLIRTFADELVYREVGGCNVLRLEHELQAGAGTAEGD